MSGHVFVCLEYRFLLLSNDFSMGFGTLQTGWYILELFRQGGIFVFFNSMAYMLYIVDALERDLRPFAVLKLFAFTIN